LCHWLTTPNDALCIPWLSFRVASVVLKTLFALPSPGSVQCVCYCLNTANNLLGNEFKEALHRKTREPNLAAKLFSGAGTAPKSGAEIATALNNVDVSAEYVQKLRHELDEFCGEVRLEPAAFPAWFL
jgi:hypothetical protein